MDSNTNIDLIFIQCCVSVVLGAIYLQSRRRRRWWVRPINQLRSEQGEYDNLMREMRESDPEQFFAYTRMSVQQFDYLLSMLEARLQKRSPREPLPPGFRLAITLRYLATGNSLQCIAWSFRIGKSTAHKVIRETTQIIWDVLSPIYLPTPSVDDIINMADRFSDRWNFPNCFGAVDGKHVTIQAPQNSGSQYFNYKKHFSIVLMAVSDADYRFTYVDIGAYGSQSDGGIFRLSDFGNKLLSETMPLPPDQPLPYTTTPLPYFIVADEAFPLHRRIMRPYSSRGGLAEENHIFNYRLSRARRVIENAFGILSARWRIFQRVISADPENVDGVIKATVCLHNYLRSDAATLNAYCPAAFVDHEVNGEVRYGDWRLEVNDTLGAFQPLNTLGRRVGSRFAGLLATTIRDQLTSYLVSPFGAVEWQLGHVRRGLPNHLQ